MMFRTISANEHHAFKAETGVMCYCHRRQAHAMHDGPEWDVMRFDDNSEVIDNADGVAFLDRFEAAVCPSHGPNLYVCPEGCEIARGAFTQRRVEAAITEVLDSYRQAEWSMDGLPDVGADLRALADSFGIDIDAWARDVKAAYDGDAPFGDENACSACGVPIAEHPDTDACAIAQEASS